MRASGGLRAHVECRNIDGQAKSIDVSSTRTDACFYLDVVELKCPFCDYRNVFGLREVCHPCPNCKAQLYNPDMN